MKRKLTPRPWHQAEQTHRRRKALGRALHQVRSIRDEMNRYNRKYWPTTQFSRQLFPRGYRIQIPRIVRKHSRLLHRVLVFGG